MKRFIVACVTLAGVFSWIVAAQTPATKRPELAILYTIDGFSDKAPARVALTGRTSSPGIHDVLWLLGRERAVARLHRAAERWRAESPLAARA